MLTTYPLDQTTIFLYISTAGALVIEKSGHYWAVYYGNRVPFTDHCLYRV